MILQMRACHVPQYMPPVSTKTIAEHVCGHIATAQEAVCDSGQSTEHSTLDDVHSCPWLIKEGPVAGRSGRHMQGDAFKEEWCI